MPADRTTRSGEPIRRLIARCGLALLVLLPAAQAHAACEPPPYRVGRARIDNPESLWVNISVSPEDVTTARMLCLASELKRRFKRPDVQVLIFDSPFVADHYFAAISVGDTGRLDEEGQRIRQATWCASCVRAKYVWHPAASEEYLLLLPLGDVGIFSEATHIDLPTTQLPACRLRVGPRCLIALEWPMYPGRPDRELSGTVTLSATIIPEGRVEDIQVAHTDTSPSDARDPLVDAARRHLASWRVEPSTREERLQITYATIIDPALPQPGLGQVEYKLPNQITVRYRPHLRQESPIPIAPDRVPFAIRLVALCGTPLALVWGWFVALRERGAPSGRVSAMLLALAAVTTNAVAFVLWVGYTTTQQYSDASWESGSWLGKYPSLTLLVLSTAGALVGPRAARWPLILGGLLGLVLWVPTSW